MINSEQSKELAQMSQTLTEAFSSIPPNGTYGLSDAEIEKMVGSFKKEIESLPVINDPVKGVGRKNAVAYQLAIECRKWKKQQSKLDADRGYRGYWP